MVRTNNLWVESDVEKLKQKYFGSKKDFLLKMFPKRTWNAIKCKATLLGLKHEFWSDAENEVLKKYYFDTPKEEILIKLSPLRNWKSAVVQATCVLGLKRDMGKFRTGELNGFYKKHHNENSKLMVSKANTGRRHSDDFKRKRAKQFMGSNNPAWIDGRAKLTHGKYPYIFDKYLINFVRERDECTCQICQRKIEGDNLKFLCTHHIDYDKFNVDPMNLIVLCSCCHTSTNFNRPLWQDYFQALMRSRFA